MSEKKVTKDDMQQWLKEAARQLRDWEERDEDVKRLCHEIDVAMFGENGAAKQPALCDILKSVQQLRQENTELKEQLSKVATAAELLTHLNDARRSEISRLNESIQQLKAMQWAELKMRQEAEEAGRARMLELIRYCAEQEVFVSNNEIYSHGGGLGAKEILTNFLKQ